MLKTNESKNLKNCTYLDLKLQELHVMDRFFKHRAYIDFCPVRYKVL